jgi:UDP-N-acetyl-D-mannosaminuronic acid transferase (WecB/TagA/CpsF family)
LSKYVQLLGVPIANLSIRDSVKAAHSGGLILAPSAPGLCDLSTDPDYREALRGADLNLPDSGLAILMMRLLGMGSLPRTSGLGFIEALLEDQALKDPGATFWVMPSHESMERNLRWLESNGIPVTEADCYLAPIYARKGPLDDQALLRRIEDARPRYVILCIGGGIQERLGLFLKQSLPYRPAICCIGAAIGFLSGDQVKIPRWADRLCLGWLLRTLSDPRRFFPRYLKALRLVWLILRYRDGVPPIKGRMGNSIR